MISWIYWDIKPEIFTIPIVNWPILWYGLFFALGFVISFPIFVSILARFFSSFSKYQKENRRKNSIALSDRLVVYIVLGTVIGARVGHFLFYESPSSYLKDPFELFRIWEGGLASHGGVIGVLLAVYLFSRKMRKNYPELTWIKLLDLLCIPSALIAFFIRLGNFFNQEILGKPTDLPWGVIFGHPADHSRPFPRHPVQLYEGLFYLLLFFLFWKMSYTDRWLKKEGFLAGLFLILIFSFRFLIEYLKEEQSYLLPDPFFLTMGQILSFPMISLGLFFLFFYRRRP